MRNLSLFVPLELACSVQGMPPFFYDPRHSVGGLSSQCHCRLRFLFTGVTEITAAEVNAKGEGDSLRMIKTLLEDRGKEEGKEAETPTAVCISSHKFVSSFSLFDVYDTLFFLSTRWHLSVHLCLLSSCGVPSHHGIAIPSLHIPIPLSIFITV